MLTDKHKAQSSIEILAYTGMFMVAIASTLTYFYPEWETNNRVTTAEATVKDIKMTVDNVYASGPGRKETITIRVPSGVTKTQAHDGRIDMVLEMPGGGTTDSIEVTAAPIKGSIPSDEGTHQLPIEYTLSGIVIVGSGLSIEPPSMQVNMTGDNKTEFTVIVSNSGDKDLSDVRINVSGVESSWLVPNETLLDIDSGASKTISVEVTTPKNTIPAIYLNYLRAESPQAYAENTINVNVEGIVCGDGKKEGLEECDTRTPYTFNDTNNPDCQNPTGAIQCDAANARYKAYDRYGDCTGGCRCRQDSPEWIICGAGCADLQYCNNCAHCYDAIQNCGETQADGGGACPICDGKDDVAEGFECDLGTVHACGISDCTGTQTCIADGAKCQWGPCTTYGLKCPTSKCCGCGGTAENPVPTYNAAYKTDCSPSADQPACGSPNTCEGGLYRGECNGIGTCSPDWDKSVWPLESNNSFCVGQTCAPANGTCYQTTYPCKGRKTTSTCSATGTCQASTTEDSSDCATLPACQAPQTIILSKLDGGQIYDYVDSPASTWMGVGVYMQWPKPCTDSQFSHTTVTQMYYTDPGVYAPYQNGTLSLYGKAWHQSNNFYQDECHWYTTNCPILGYGSNIRIGTDANNYLQYQAPTWTPNWQRGTVNLKNPQMTVGSVDWNNIRFLQFNYVVALECQPTDTGCGTCTAWLDYVTLSK